MLIRVIRGGLSSDIFKQKAMKYSFLGLFLILSTLCGAQVDTSSKPERLCPNAFNVVKNDKTYTLRYASNHPITEYDKKIKQLIIYVHGARRNGMDYFEWGETAVKSVRKNAETLLIAPQFASAGDLKNHNLDIQHLFWEKNNWRSGDESVSSKTRFMTESFSSYALVDSMIARVCNPKMFPNLKKIIVIGHSAGGQFLQRYAGMTPMPNILSKGLPAERGYQFRFIAMNPSSYVYLDDRRPIKTGDKLTFARPDTTGCNDFNTYPKGFENLNPYAEKVGGETIKKQFLSRDVVFLLGGNDVDMTDPNLDKTCSGNMQGRFRLERGLFFYEYVQTFSKNGKIHRMEVVPNVAHSGDKMINDVIAQKYLFD